MFAAGIRRKRVSRMRSYSNWRWRLDEVFVKINRETHYLWRGLDHEGEVLEGYVTKLQDRKAAFKCLTKAKKRYGGPEVVVTDKLRSYGAPILLTRQIQAQPNRRSYRVAPPIEYVNSAGVSNLMRVLIRLTAPPLNIIKSLK